MHSVLPFYITLSMVIWGKEGFAQLLLIIFCFPLFRVVFNEVVQTSKYFMRDVTAVESSWLVELAPHFYKQAKVWLEQSRRIL